MRNKTIGLLTGIVVVLMILAITPTASAVCPAPIPGETGVAGPNFSFSYGENAAYGAYLRDVQWNSMTNGWDRYFGTLNVPWFRINGITHNPPGIAYGATPPVCTPGAGPATPDFSVLYTYTFTIGMAPEIHTVTYQIDLWHLPPWAPTVTEANINIITTHSVAHMSPPGTPIGPWIFDFAVRADFDIAGFAGTPNLGYTCAGGPWMLQIWEMVFTTIAPGDPMYAMDVFQEDNAIISGAPVPGSGPWAGIAGPKFGPFNPEDYFLLVYRNNEFRGNPAGYVTGQGINPADIVMWHDTGFQINNPGGISGGPGVVTSVTIISSIWMQ